VTALIEVATRSLESIEGLLVRGDEPLPLHTSFRLGGAARLWIEPSSVDQVSRALPVLSAMRWTVLGAGTNVLYDDGVFEGAVLCTRALQGCVVTGRELRASAGTPLGEAIRAATEAGLSGLERLWGIPGTVGGAVAGNAGAFGQETFDCLFKIRLVGPDGSVLSVSPTALKAGYRRGGIPAHHVVVEALWILQPREPQAIKASMDEVARNRAASQPWGHPTAGCVFRNPPGTSAGRLIDQAGLKGARVGGAVVSPVHANFIVLDGPASAHDVLQLIRLVKSRVEKTFGVCLDTELSIIEGGA